LPGIWLIGKKGLRKLWASRSDSYFESLTKAYDLEGSTGFLCFRLSNTESLPHWICIWEKNFPRYYYFIHNRDTRGRLGVAGLEVAPLQAEAYAALTK